MKGNRITLLITLIFYAFAMPLQGKNTAGSKERSLIPHPIDWENPRRPLVDFSNYLAGPAGQDGFIHVKNDRLVKPDGSRFRIWGVNMTSGFCFPSHEESEAMADDLARMGVNCVRFHGLDSNWGRSAIDQSRDDTQHLDEDNMERFDYLVWQLKKRGIYINLNLNVFRKYKAGDDIRDFRSLYFGKSATYFNPRLLELQRDYARKLLTHRNRYTGKEYRYEPAVMCIELINENSVLEGWINWRLVGRDEENPGTWSPIPVSYAQELNEQLNDWFREQYPAEKLAVWRQEAGVDPKDLIPCLKPDQFGSVSRERFHAEAEFYFQLENRFFSMMRKFLKQELGVRQIVIGTADHNDGFCGYAQIEANMQFDVIDGHGYWQHPHLGKVTRITNTPMVNDPWDSTIIQFARTPVKGRPYTISETNHPFPHEYACEGIPSLTAYALFQDWDGIYWFCYNRGPMQKPQGIPRNGWFDMSADPVKVTQIAACAPIWHRQDIATAHKTVLRSYTHDQILELLRSDRGKMKPFFTEGFAKTTPLMHATRFTLDGSAPSVFPKEINPNAIESDTGQLGWYDAKKQRGVITIDSPKTQALIGYVTDLDRTTKNMRVKVTNRFCSIQLSSLDNRPISTSRRLLLTTAALATNTDIQWEKDRKTLASWGQAPALIEPVKGKIILKGLSGTASKAVITPLTVTGRQQATPATVPLMKGQVHLPVGDPACTWYLVQLK